MVYIGTVGLGIPNYNISQHNVKQLVQHIFQGAEAKINKLMPVFDHAKIKDRQFVVPENWFRKNHSFEETNELYFKYSKEKSLEAIDHCLSNQDFLHKSIPYEAIDMIVFVSSTGIVTPSMDAFLLSERSFREDVVRMPLWGLGCAGGASGLARAFDWIKSHPDKTALVICCELCSLTFQKKDLKMGNLVGTALFGDGVSAVLLVGKQSNYLSYLKSARLQIRKTASFTKKNSTSIMGWNVTNNGLEVIFSKRIPRLVKSLWKNHLMHFLQELQIPLQKIDTILAHPGGRKVLESMEETLNISSEKLRHSYRVLLKHGNMSSSTVIYVLNEWLKEETKKENGVNILCALGPGFSSELMLLEWNA